MKINNTASKRIGAILIALYLVIAVVLAVTWNVMNGPFIYLSNDWDLELTIPPKPADKTGTKWIHHDRAWRQIDTKCNAAEAQSHPPIDMTGAETITDKKIIEETLKEYNPKKGPVYNADGSFLFSKECIVLSKNDADTSEWKSDFGDFLAWLFIDIWPLSLFLLSGFLLFCGAFDATLRLIKCLYLWIKYFYVWIKTGKWPERKSTDPKKRKNVFIAAFLITLILFTISFLESGTISRVFYKAFLGGIIGGLAALCYMAYNFICSLGKFGKIVEENSRLIFFLLLVALFTLPFFF